MADLTEDWQLLGFDPTCSRCGEVRERPFKTICFKCRLHGALEAIKASDRVCLLPGKVRYVGPV